MIEVNDPNNVTIDGQAAGRLVDVSMNYQSRLPELQAAVDAYMARRAKEAIAATQDAADAAAEQAAKEASEAARLAEQKAAAATQESERLRQQVKAMQQQIDALGGTELAQKLARERRIEELKEQQAKAAAELAELADPEA